MTWDSTPWAIGGGAHNSVEVARLATFAATGGSEGIVTPDSLKVDATAVVSAAVQVGKGSCLILNRSLLGEEQTYAARKTAVDTIAVPGTGGSGARSDLIIARVEDPQYAPWQAPPDPVSAQYIFTRRIAGVPAGTETAAHDRHKRNASW